MEETARKNIHLNPQLKAALGGNVKNLTRRLTWVADVAKIATDEAEKSLFLILSDKEMIACLKACWSTAFPEEVGGSAQLCVGLTYANVADSFDYELEITEVERKELVRKLRSLTTVQDIALCRWLVRERKRLSGSKETEPENDEIG